MYSCSICCKDFKTNWQLQRHLRKKIPCKISKPPVAANEPPVTANEPPVAANEPPVTVEKYWCKYCETVFKRNQNLQNHFNICKEKKDDVRCLEIRLDINYYPKNKNKYECRFCHSNSTTSSHLNRHLTTCKAKQEYREHLKKLIKKETATTINNITNNITNNNNTINNNTQINNLNIVVNPIGKENLDYITTKTIKKLRDTYTSNDVFVAKMIELIHANEDHPENQNIKYTNLRSNTAKVKYKDTFEFMNVDTAVNEMVKNFADSIAFNDEYQRVPRTVADVFGEHEGDKKTNNMIKMKIYNNSRKSNQSCLT